MLKQSDILSVHLPLNEATRGLIGREQIALMKKTAVLINCARGPIVDQQALKSLRFTVDDLLEGLRQKDVFDLSAVQSAVVETNGTLSVLLKAAEQPAKTGLFQKRTPRGVILATVGRKVSVIYYIGETRKCLASLFSEIDSDSLSDGVANDISSVVITSNLEARFDVR